MELLEGADCVEGEIRLMNSGDVGRQTGFPAAPGALTAIFQNQGRACLSVLLFFPHCHSLLNVRLCCLSGLKRQQGYTFGGRTVCDELPGPGRRTCGHVTLSGQRSRGSER